ncbi:MAG TPA: EamA family transporter RarD [Verrucomicrobiota bacterium]|nr:EamA family transporter RarD [Verrucomicrobiota bacterium]HNU51937.1 EamA family transporter RarD [Verrucomicrobiota bacterium]
MESNRRSGVAEAVGAYVLWGLLPVYWKLLQSVPALQILGHRVVWSFVFLMALVGLRGEGAIFRRAWQRPRTVAIYTAASVLLAVNWLTYIWSVNHDRIVETSLGYYINPLVSVLLAVGVLRERLRRLQWLAVAMAAGAVVFLTWQHGALPWEALILALSFGAYGLLKKTAPLEALPGLAMETAVLCLPAAAYLGLEEACGAGAIATGDGWRTLLLGLTGVVTATPLLLFAQAARRIRLSTIGLLQYISPTCGLVLGVLVYREPFTWARAFGFGVIWVALALFWFDGARHTWGRRIGRAG